MAKFTRTAYASGSLRDIARVLDADIAAAIGGALPDLHQRKAGGRRRVQITVSVETAPVVRKRAKGPKRVRPVQQSLLLEPTDAEFSKMCDQFARDIGLPSEMLSIVPDAGERLARAIMGRADGGST